MIWLDSYLHLMACLAIIWYSHNIVKNEIHFVYQILNILDICWLLQWYLFHYKTAQVCMFRQAIHHCSLNGSYGSEPFLFWKHAWHIQALTLFSKDEADKH